jgi:excisionase family DNA binding protein
MQADVLTVSEAAAKLGISGQRVRQLISAGSLPARRSSAGWLIKADDVLARDRRKRGRPVSPRTAWAVICMLSSALDPKSAAGSSCEISDPRLRYHALQLLRTMPDPADDPGRWRALLASRSHAERMWVHPGILPRLIEEPQVRVGGSAGAAHIGEGLSQPGLRDLYVDQPDVKHVIASYRLRPDPEGQVMLNVVPSSVPQELLRPLGRSVPVAAAAADLLDEDDPRASRSARLQLHAMHDALLSEYQLRPDGAGHARRSGDARGPGSAR